MQFFLLGSDGDGFLLPTSCHSRAVVNTSEYHTYDTYQ